MREAADGESLIVSDLHDSPKLASVCASRHTLQFAGVDIDGPACVPVCGRNVPLQRGEMPKRMHPRGQLTNLANRLIALRQLLA